MYKSCNFKFIEIIFFEVEITIKHVILYTFHRIDELLPPQLGIKYMPSTYITI